MFAVRAGYWPVDARSGAPLVRISDAGTHSKSADGSVINRAAARPDRPVHHRPAKSITRVNLSRRYDDRPHSATDSRSFDSVDSEGLPSFNPDHRHHQRSTALTPLTPITQASGFHWRKPEMGKHMGRTDGRRDQDEPNAVASSDEVFAGRRLWRAGRARLRDEAGNCDRWRGRRWGLRRAARQPRMPAAARASRSIGAASRTFAHDTAVAEFRSRRRSHARPIGVKAHRVLSGDGERRTVVDGGTHEASEQRRRSMHSRMSSSEVSDETRRRNELCWKWAALMATRK